MAAKKITLKIARKKPGSISRSRVRSAVAAVYNASTEKNGSPKAGHLSPVMVTFPKKISALK